MSRPRKPSRSGTRRTPPPPPPPPPPPAVDDSLASGWIAAAVLLMLAPTLAHTPQSGDGAEIVTAALRGGVLHPTGFPLQAWLDRALAQMPGLPVALAISALGLVAHAAAAGLVAETLRTIGVGPAGRLWGAAAFALLPSLWAVA